jgi:hypothetical protein
MMNKEVVLPRLSTCILACAVAFVSTTAAYAQQSPPTRIPVYVAYNVGDGDNGEGQQFVYSFKQEISNSAEYLLSDSSSQNEFEIILSAMPNKLQNGQYIGIVYSAVVVIHMGAKQQQGDIYLNSGVGTCSPGEAAQCAYNQAASALNQLDTLKNQN